MRRLFDREAPYGQAGIVIMIYAIAVVVFRGDSKMTIVALAATLATVAVGIDLMLGYGGLLALSSTAFMLVGAESTAVVTKQWNVDGTAGTLAGVGFGIVVTTALAGGLGFVTLRVRGLGLALVTIFFTFISLNTVVQFDVLGGSFGVTGIPSFQIGSFVANTPVRKAVVAICLLALSLFVSARLMSSDAAREVKAVRDDEQAAAASGVSVGRRKVEIFVLGSVLASVAGSVYAQSQNFVGPTSYEIHVLLSILLYAYIGGMGTIWGAAIGALIVEFVPQYLHFIGDARFAIEGVAFLVLLVWSQAGIAGVGSRWRLTQSLLPVPEPGPRATPSALQDRSVEADAPLLVVSDVTVQFGGLRALDGVSFEVDVGAVHGLIGPNGAGKSTLFNVMSGIIRPQSGAIGLDGRPTAEMSTTDLARAGLGRTFQNVRLFSHLSVLDNVIIGTGASNGDLLIGGLTAKRRKGLDDAWAALHRLGITDLAHERADSLPLGTQRLVEIARALAARPMLLLLDEPASGLSAAERGELSSVLSALRGEVTMVVVEHDIAFIAGLADRTTVLDGGRRIFDGTVADALADPGVIESYLGSSRRSATGAGAVP